MGVRGPRVVVGVEEESKGGVEAAEGDEADGSWSNGFGRSRPFGSALGVKSAGVEGQNLSIVSICRSRARVLKQGSGRRCDGRRWGVVGRCAERGGGWGERNVRLVLSCAGSSPFSPLPASPLPDEISNAKSRVPPTTADAFTFATSHFPLPPRRPREPFSVSRTVCAQSITPISADHRTNVFSLSLSLACCSPHETTESTPG